MQVSTDWVGLIDEWARRFFAELDYEAEGATALQFQREMAQLEGIVVPQVFMDLTTRSVLTTAWVEGALLALLLPGSRGRALARVKSRPIQRQQVAPLLGVARRLCCSRAQARS